MWDELRSAWLDELNDANFEFQISHVEPGGKFENYFVQSHTRFAKSKCL